MDLFNTNSYTFMLQNKKTNATTIATTTIINDDNFHQNQRKK